MIYFDTQGKSQSRMCKDSYLQYFCFLQIYIKSNFYRFKYQAHLARHKHNMAESLRIIPTEIDREIDKIDR